MIEFFVVLSLLLFSGCSLHVEKNEWQYKSSRAFHSFTKEYLSAHEILAKADKKAAEHYAKQSADLETLARVYLGECAIYKSVGVLSTCKEYQELAMVVNDATLQAYFMFINQKLTPKTVQNLPKKYQPFAQAWYKQEYNKAFEILQKCDDDISKLLWAALIKEHLTQQQREQMLSIASYNGYKKAVLFWLSELKKYEKELNKRKLIDKKIAILLK